MIDLIRGNEDNLQGKATIFSEIECDRCGKYNYDNPPIIAGYFSTDILDFMQKTKIPKEIIEKILKTNDLMKIFNNWNNMNNASVGNKIKIISFFSPLYHIESKLEVIASSSSEDIVFTGKYSDIWNCQDSIHLGWDMYKMKFEEQMLKNLKLKKNDSKFEAIIPKKKYEEINGGEIYDYLKNNYITKIIDYAKEKDFKDYLLHSFVEFGMKTPYANDIINIAKILKNDNLQNNELKMIGLYMNKITLIHQEKYEEAGKINEVIKTFNKE